MLKLA